MIDLVKRLAAVRESARVADVFEKRPRKAEFKMTCVPVMMGYAME